MHGLSTEAIFNPVGVATAAAAPREDGVGGDVGLNPFPDSVVALPEGQVSCSTTVEFRILGFQDVPPLPTHDHAHATLWAS